MRTSNNDSYFLFFQNMTQVNGFKGFVGYGIRELDSSETKSYCWSPNTIPNSFPLTKNQVNFTSDFMIRQYTSSCYFFDSSSGKWSSKGMDNFIDTNLQQTHCLSTHLTNFAGGLVVYPNNINFQYAYANASFTQNLAIYIVLILFLILYIFFAIWALFMDKVDASKLRIIPLKDNNVNDDYFYEVKVFTGNRPEAGTRSKVYFIFIFNIF